MKASRTLQLHFLAFSVASEIDDNYGMCKTCCSMHRFDIYWCLDSIQDVAQEREHLQEQCLSMDDREAKSAPS